LSTTWLHAVAERVAALEAGADDFLSKPVEIGTLTARVRSLVRLKRLLDEWRARCATACALGLEDGDEAPVSVAGARALAIVEAQAQVELVMRALGHGTGDRALQAVAATLRANIRVSDTLSRVGGEEFVVVMPGTSAAEAAAAAERLREAVAALEGDFSRGEAGRLTVSIGIARSDKAAEPEALLNAADAALYEAKRTGRNRIYLAEGTADHSFVLSGLAGCREEAT